MAVLSVTDRAHGIAPENLTRLFDPFSRPKGRTAARALASASARRSSNSAGAESALSRSSDRGRPFWLGFL
jgi:hypothetical protein